MPRQPIADRCPAPPPRRRPRRARRGAAACVTLAAALLTGACDEQLIASSRFAASCATAGCPCAAAGECDDGEACTEDSCASGGCAFAAVQDDKGCEDGDLCTVDDRCAAGRCAGTPRVCNDGNACTVDACKDGSCGFTVRVGACDDGDRCTVDDGCKDGTCAAGSPRPLWQVVLASAGDDHAMGVAPAPEGGVYVAGFRLPKPNEWRARVLRLAASGAVVFDQLYPSGVSSQLYGAAADGEGGVYAVGIWWVNTPNATLENWRPVVIRIGADGKELWKQIDGQGGKLEPVVVLPGGDVLALGYQQFQPPSRPLAWRLSKDGGTEVKRLLLGDGSTRGRLYGARLEADGGVVAVGRDGGEGVGSQGLIVRYGGEGDFEVAASVGQSGVDDALRAIALTAGGDRFAVGQRLSNPAVPWLARQTPGAGASSSDVAPPNKGGHAGLEAAARAGDGTLVVGGNAVTTGIDRVWWLAGLGEDGTRLWSREGPTLTGGGTDDTLRDCVEIADGSVVCVGQQSELGGGGDRDIIALRVDGGGKSGCR